jgi:hypothetical protein
MPPAPKRAEQVARRNKRPRAQVDGGELYPAPMPPTPRNLNPVARRWYKSLGESGQAQFYTSSDWATAIVAAHLLSEYMDGGRPVAIIAEWRALSTALLATEADRRRVYLELQASAKAGEKVDTASTIARRVLGVA